MTSISRPMGEPTYPLAEDRPLYFKIATGRVFESPPPKDGSLVIDFLETLLLIIKNLNSSISDDYTIDDLTIVNNGKPFHFQASLITSKDIELLSLNNGKTTKQICIAVKRSTRSKVESASASHLALPATPSLPPPAIPVVQLYDPHTKCPSAHTIGIQTLTGHILLLKQPLLDDDITSFLEYIHASATEDHALSKTSTLADMKFLYDGKEIDLKPGEKITQYHLALLLNQKSGVTLVHKRALLVLSDF